MNAILNFFVDNYVWFLVICFILIFALIGYFVDTKKDERFSTKIEIDRELESKLEAAGAANLTINEMMKSSNSKDIVQDEKIPNDVKDDKKEESKKVDKKNSTK